MNRLPTVEHFKHLTNRIQRRSLANGLSVLLYPDRSVPVVTTMLFYRAGTRFEQQGATGISHFLEHMMFKGSRGYRKGEIDLLTALNGGANNAFTSSDYTSYYFTFASDRWVQALEIESDRMHLLKLDEGEFELERQVILEELRMELDDPWYLLRERIEEVALGDHPYRFPIIGRRVDVKNLTLAALEEYYRRHYNPSNAVLVVAGDIHPDETLDQVTRLFGEIPAGCRPEETNSLFPQRPSPGRIEMAASGRVARLLLAFQAPAICKPDHYPFHLLDRILAEGKLSRLYQRLVERTPLAAFVAGDFADTAEPYLYFLQLELLPGARLDRLEPILMEELERLREEEISAEELNRVQNQTILETVASFETSFDLAAQIGLTELLGLSDYWSSYLERIEAVTSVEVREAARRYLRDFILGAATLE